MHYVSIQWYKVHVKNKQCGYLITMNLFGGNSTQCHSRSQWVSMHVFSSLVCNRNEFGIPVKVKYLELSKGVPHIKETVVINKTGNDIIIQTRLGECP